MYMSSFVITHGKFVRFQVSEYLELPEVFPVRAINIASALRNNELTCCRIQIGF